MNNWQGLRSPPLKDWERADKINIECVGYGWQEKRVIVRFHLPKDRDVDRIQLATALMGRDIKHSKNWLCEFCGGLLLSVLSAHSLLRRLGTVKIRIYMHTRTLGRPACESHFQNLSWHHLDPPRLVIYIHFVCAMEAPHVRQGLTQSHNTLNLMQGGAMGPMPAFETFGKRPAGTSYPLAGSCAACQRDDSAEGAGASLLRCSRCKMTRYCGVECQKSDWKRHKVACATIHSVNFENWD
ncbi:hypothetical protein C2E23DRAFT_417762 [Lenzites betulinus]|nr:hypothetical protein C2E23DRAFT_417762 [Lenzites betulinus]